MKLKEVLNLRKLKEEFYDKNLSCEDCPFHEQFCRYKTSSDCIVKGIFENDPFTDYIEDLYEMERKGTLKKDFQIEPIESGNF